MEQICTFYLNSFYFGLPVRSIQEIIRPQPLTHVPLAASDICGLINLRGQIVTVVDLQGRLEMSAASNDDRFNIVVQSEDEVVSFLVDDVGDVLEFTANLEPPPAHLKGKIRQVLSGAYPLSEGFLLVLDPQKILDPQFT